MRTQLCGHFEREKSEIFSHVGSKIDIRASKTPISMPSCETTSFGPRQYCIMHTR